MKTKLVLLFAVCSFLTSQAQCSGNVKIPDAIFKAALVANTTINTNGDNEISCTEAKAFTGNILVVDKSIADITGIEAFINMTYYSIKLKYYEVKITVKTGEMTMREVLDN
jgi:hypothetical protein